MQPSTDLFLGTFLILCGFAISLINLRRIIKQQSGTKSTFQRVLLSENVLIVCIGIAFVSRSVYEFNPINISMSEMLERSGEIKHNMRDKSAINCSFMSVLMSYGPLIVPLVNSFVSLIVDNYMHYTVLEDAHKKEEENYVQEIGERSRDGVKEINNTLTFVKKHFPIIAAGLQWMVPLMLTISMYPIEVKEQDIATNQLRSLETSCMTMLGIANESCISINQSDTLELRNYLLPENYLIAHESTQNLSMHKTAEIKSVIEKIYGIINNFGKAEQDHLSVNVSSQTLVRTPKTLQQSCLKMCYLETKSLLLYMFLLSVVSYFVPITISTIILTKIHAMNVKKPNVRTYVTRELLYNILFWTPVMFDSFVSLILCSYTMNGMRTSIFHVIANVYQVVKNFMNTKYFKDNAIAPV